MLRPTDFLRRSLRWLSRIRHRCGYGVHSPYCFGFITEVVYEDAAYYAYETLAPRRLPLPAAPREKDDRLLLRIANRLQPRTVAGIGSGQAFRLSMDYLRAGKAADFHCAATAAALARLLPAVGAVDLLYLDTDEWPDALQAAWSRLSGEAAIIIRYTPQRRHTLPDWQKLCEDARVRVTFDLYDFRIALFLPRLQKENHIVNYF
ncbi:MAG: hypothetical protein ACI353_07120 [Alloprevotella sp.]